jgi:hypothetical protein
MQILCQVPYIATRGNVFFCQKAHPRAVDYFFPTLELEGQSITLETND